MERLYIVTGAAGHLGSTVIRMLLDRGMHVRGLLLPDEIPPFPEAEYVRGNVLDLESLRPLFYQAERQQLYVIHTAGLVDISGDETRALWSVNVGGTNNMIALSMKYHAARFVYVGSVHAIPEPTHGELVTEAEQFTPNLVIGGYAKSKAAATQAVLDGAKSGLPAVVVQPSGILGPYDCGRNHLVQMLLDFMKGRLPACASGGYDIVDVRDVAEGCLLAAERGRLGQCYILSGAHLEIRELLNMTAHLCGKRCPPVFPMFLLLAAEPFLYRWAKSRGQRPLYTKYSLHTIATPVRFSSEKARKELGYVTRSAQNTVRDTVEWLLKHGLEQEGKQTKVFLPD